MRGLPAGSIIFIDTSRPDPFTVIVMLYAVPCRFELNGKEPVKRPSLIAAEKLQCQDVCSGRAFRKPLVHPRTELFLCGAR